MNNTLGYYRELSIYGRDIPLACLSVITKVNAIFSGIIFGIAQSSQPIIGYNFGAKNFKRVPKPGIFKKSFFILIKQIVKYNIGT